VFVTRTTRSDRYAIAVIDRITLSSAICFTTPHAYQTPRPEVSKVSQQRHPGIFGRDTHRVDRV